MKSTIAFALFGIAVSLVLISCGKPEVGATLGEPTVYKLPADERAKCPRPDEIMESAIITYFSSGAVKHLEVTCKVQTLGCK